MDPQIEKILRKAGVREVRYEDRPQGSHFDYNERVIYVSPEDVQKYRELFGRAGAPADEEYVRKYILLHEAAHAFGIPPEGPGEAIADILAAVLLDPPAPHVPVEQLREAMHLYLSFLRSFVEAEGAPYGDYLPYFSPHLLPFIPPDVKKWLEEKGFSVSGPEEWKNVWEGMDKANFRRIVSIYALSALSGSSVAQQLVSAVEQYSQGGMSFKGLIEKVVDLLEEEYRRLNTHSWPNSSSREEITRSGRTQE